MLVVIVEIVVVGYVVFFVEVYVESVEVFVDVSVFV